MDSDGYLAALRARDVRFDGVFFVGITSTGIYCRPICPARAARADRMRFFASAALAEVAGFRACFRCRPEVAPGNAIPPPSRGEAMSGSDRGARPRARRSIDVGGARASVDAVPALARAAARRIDAGYLNDHSVEQLADRLGVTDRHLRRALETELGASPVELAQTRRLALAKQLLHDSRLGLSEVAFAAGFASVRRFNAAFRGRFGRPPSAVRRELTRTPETRDVITLRMDARPPHDWPALLCFLAARAIPGVEQVDGEVYRRGVVLDRHRGWLEAGPARRDGAIEVRVATSLAPRLMQVQARVRALFDLDAHPAAIATRLAADPRLAPLLRARPGLRVPGAFDGWELAVRAILGQQISVAAATTFAGRLVARFGEPNPQAPPGIDRAMPDAARLAAAGAAELATIGLPLQRARTIASLAEAVAAGTIELSADADPAATVAALVELPGIGPWTANYVAMRALAWPDAFLAGDLIVRRALDVTTAPAAERLAEPWRPWRAYAVLHLWSSS